MTQQRLHSALAPIDVLTRLEMEEVLHKGLNDAVRARYIGLDSARIPPITAQGNGGTINLGALSTQDPFCGPEQGDVWLLRRVNVVSSAFTTDTARYIVFRGSSPSDYANAYSNRQVLDGQAFQPAVSNPVPAQPAVPASTVAVQNPNTYPVNVTLSGFTATAVFVNGIQVGTTNGTYLVPSGGTISVTYTVAGTWVWANANGASVAFQLGQQQGIAYQIGNKACLLQPGEQIYAQVYNTTVGNTYLLTGEAIRVPAEMKGKVLT